MKIYAYARVSSQDQNWMHSHLMEYYPAIFFVIRKAVKISTGKTT